MDQAAKEFYERSERRGIKKTLRAMVVGVPNVGKSTFINRLTGSATTDVADRPGVTRANRWVKVNPYLEVLDTPGMLWPKLDDRQAAARLAYIGTIRDAVYDQLELSIRLLGELLKDRREVTAGRFKIKNLDAKGIELLDEVCRGRGFLLKGGVSDTDRAAAVILDEFRAGKLGRITLEFPPGVGNRRMMKPSEKRLKRSEALARPRLQMGGVRHVARRYGRGGARSAARIR